MSTEQAQAPSIDLLPHQDEELAHLLDDSDEGYPLTFICGGRGSGKSETDYLQLFLRSERCVDQPYALIANTEAQLQTFVSIITEKLDEIGMAHVYETNAPKAWRARWRREGIKTPPRRLRNMKMWIWEDGTHVATFTISNNSYTRIKSLDCQAAIIEEGTEPGVTRNAITTIIGAVRCGLGKSVDGQSECKRRRHLHEVVVKFNVPLHDPSNYVYKYNDELQAKEAQRKLEGKRPFFRLIESSTLDNPHTGEDYDERLKAALDADTYEQQTSGKLIRNIAALSYHSFSAANVLDGIGYDEKRDLHLWFDFNNSPATAGWGHDLKQSEVPAEFWRVGRPYFGVVGELHSDNDPMQTDQVATALLEDPVADGRCREIECGHQLEKHQETGMGFLCRTCLYERTLPGGLRWFCSGQPVKFEATRKYIHAPANWRGLIRHRGRIFVYADASGVASHADAHQTGGSLRILRDAFNANLGSRVHFRIKKSNPPINLRVLAVNRMLCAKDGIRSLFIAPWCTEHEADFLEIVPDPKTGDPKKTTRTKSNAADGYWKRTHCSDGAGYMADYRWPAIVPRASGMPIGPDGDIENHMARPVG